MLSVTYSAVFIVTSTPRLFGLNESIHNAPIGEAIQGNVTVSLRFL